MVERLPSANSRPGVPLYLRLKEHIREQVSSGEWPGDKPIPSERQLCEQFGLARGTVRQALDELLREGLIYTRRGKGNFVARPKLTQSLLDFPSFLQTLSAQGHRTASTTRSVGLVPASPTVAEALQVLQGAPTIEIQKTRLVDGEPLCLLTSHVPQALFPDLLEKDLQRDLYEVLQSDFGTVVRWIRVALEPTGIDLPSSRLLQVREGSPGLLMERTAIAGDRPVVFARFLIRGDRCRLTLALSSTSASAEEVPFATLA